MGTIKTTNIEPIATNGTVTLGGSGDTFTVPSGVTVNMSNATQTGVGGTNTPAWSAKRGSAQTGIADSASVTIVCDTEELDTDNAYNTSTGEFTVPSGKGGKYMVGASYRTNASGAATRLASFITVGGTIIRQTNFNQNSSGEGSSSVHGVLNLSAGDVVAFKMYQNTGSAVNAEADGKTYFYGYKLIGA